MIIKSISDAEKLGDVFPNYQYIKEKISVSYISLEDIEEDIETIIESIESEMDSVPSSIIISLKLIGKCISSIQTELNETAKYIPDLNNWDKFDEAFYEWLDTLDIKEFTPSKKKLE